MNMKKFLVLLFLLVGTVLPLACSDTGNPVKPPAPSGNGSSTSVATIASTPGTPTPTPTFAVATPAYVGEWPASSAPNGFALISNALYVAE
ncbi:MAG TPA: hypothetical protein VMV05_00690, partial [bacterium]|nr:hypothetical protein [bacterium]